MSAPVNLRLRVLLAWAIDYVELHANTLEECSTNAEGEYDEDDSTAEEEVAECRRWLAEAREAMREP